MTENLHKTPMYSMTTGGYVIGVKNQYHPTPYPNDAWTYTFSYKTGIIKDGMIFIPPGATVQVTIYERYKQTTVRVGIRRNFGPDMTGEFQLHQGTCEDLTDSKTLRVTSNEVTAGFAPFKCYTPTADPEWYYIKMDSASDADMLEVRFSVRVDRLAHAKWWAEQTWDADGNPGGTEPPVPPDPPDPPPPDPPDPPDCEKRYAALSASIITDLQTLLTKYGG